MVGTQLAPMATAGEHDVSLADELFDRLFPICRSITGPGLRASLDILGEVIPLERESIPSGTGVFDWVVPREWRIRSARLTGPDGEVLADFAQTNLAVVNYSVPVDRELSLEELEPHLHSLPELPDAIPYVTSYYRENWGFCLPHRVRERLRPGTYRAFIDSELVDGQLDWGHAILPGESRREILLSSYLCHPSLANNELSGPIVLALLWRRLSRWPRRRYTYRFVLAPETIGSLCYLFRHGDELRERLAAGIVLTCLGGPTRALSWKRTRREDTLLDRVVERLAEEAPEDWEIRPFTPAHGSDERQYGSPGFALPVGQLARTVYGTYEGYHNSLDDKSFMGIETLVDSAARIEGLLRLFELAGPWVNLRPHGEVQLGRRGLYPTMNGPATRSLSSDAVADGRVLLERILHVLSWSDGTRDVAWIAARAGCRMADLEAPVARLEEEGLLAWRGPAEEPA